MRINGDFAEDACFSDDPPEKKTPVIHSRASEEISTMSQIVHRFAKILQSVIKIVFLQTDFRRNICADTET